MTRHRIPTLTAAGILAMSLATLTGCASGPSIDTRYTAQGQDSRVLFLILHYTDENLADSIRILTQQQVSSHYLLSDESPPVIYRLVDENRRAWHAGDSFWKGNAMLNASSIGIEIVNAGGRLPQGGQQHGPAPAARIGDVQFAPYPPAQIDALIALVKDIVTRHQIKPERILGHSDIAPQRKIDPGAAFPWKRLADAGLIPWPDAQKVAAQQKRYEQALPDVAWFQQALAAHGFKVPSNGVLDEATRRVISAFQLKYRPEKFDGQPDAHTAALLQVLTAPAP